MKKNKMPQKEKKKKLELVNYEGPVLTLIKITQDEFKLIDQWKKEIRKLSRVEVLQYLTGEIELEDSSGKSYSHLKTHREAKPNLKKVDSFLYGD